jgi:multidrug efflux pump subunit AcrA (membrane-fusion protein)
MLNISPDSITNQIPQEKYKSFEKTALSSANVMFARWMGGLFLLAFFFLFLPWTQNIQSKGKVTTLRPEQRPQTVQSTISGQIQQWYVREGDTVRKGDTILHLTEIKAEYFDPQIVERTQRQVDAKTGSVGAYVNKAEALAQQIEAYREELAQKRNQLENKLQQTRLKIITDSIAFRRAILDDSIARVQLKRADALFKDGIKPRTDVEDKRFKVQETEAKVVDTRNKLNISRQDMQILRVELRQAVAETAQKIAKAESDIASAQSDRFTTEADISKLQIQVENYRQRNTFYFVLAPQDGIIAKALQAGIGENIKDGDPIVSIQPLQYTLAVEMFVKPLDYPLVNLGQEVRFLFDGWPAIVFSGWPGFSFGTFKGKVVAIDNIISDNGMYRILIAPNEADGKKWPMALRPGSGAQGIALLNNVPLWFELWRQLNGFPPNYYKNEEGKSEEPKLKAPVKNLK